MDINFKQLQKYYSNIMFKQNVSEFELRKLEQFLKKLLYSSNLDKTKIYPLLAKLYFKQEKYQKVKDIYYENKENTGINYLMFQILIIEKKYQEALEKLNKYEELLLKNNMRFNNTGLYLLLNNLLEEKTTIYDDNFIGTLRIKDEELIKEYNNFILNVKNEKYKDALENIINCQSLSDSLNIKINFQPYKDLLFQLKEKQTKEFEENIDSIVLSYENKDDYVNQCNELAKQKYNLYKMLKLCNNLINNNYFNEAEELLEELKKYNSSFLYKTEIKYLENKINENKFLNNLSENELKKYNTIKKEAKEALNNEDFATALNYYEAGLYIYETPEFIYYIGKTYLKYALFLKKQELNYKTYLKTALNYLTKYPKKGANKYDKCVLYISLAYSILKKHLKNKNELLDITKQIKQLEDKPFKLDFLYYYSSREKHDVYDSKPKRLIKNIVITEEEFLNKK